MHEIYENQKAQFPEDLKKYARQIGIKNKKKFDQCLDSDRYRGLVNQDMEDGAGLGISGTPGFFIGRYDSVNRRIKEGFFLAKLLVRKSDCKIPCQTLMRPSAKRN